MGFQEATDVKESVSEARELKHRDGVLRRTSRSLQARPISMPVDKYLLMGLQSEDQEAVADATKSENSSGKWPHMRLLKCSFCEVFISSVLHPSNNPMHTHLGVSPVELGRTYF